MEEPAITRGCDVRARCSMSGNPRLKASSRGFHEFPTTVRGSLSRVAAARTIGALPLRCRHSSTLLAVTPLTGGVGTNLPLGGSRR